MRCFMAVADFWALSFPIPALDRFKETTGSESDGVTQAVPNLRVPTARLQQLPSSRRKSREWALEIFFKDKPMAKTKVNWVENDFLLVEKVCLTVCFYFHITSCIKKLPRRAWRLRCLCLSWALIVLCAAHLLCRGQLLKRLMLYFTVAFLAISCLWNVSQGDFSLVALPQFLWRKATHAWSQLNTWPWYFSRQPPVSLLSWNVSLVLCGACWLLLCTREKGLCIFFSRSLVQMISDCHQEVSCVHEWQRYGPLCECLGLSVREGWLFFVLPWFWVGKRQTACCCWLFGCHSNTPRNRQ